MAEKSKYPLHVRIIARITPNCDEVTRLSSESLDRKLSLKERFMLRLHQKICYLCRHYEDQIGAINQACQGPDVEKFSESGDACMSQDRKNVLKDMLVKENEAER